MTIAQPDPVLLLGFAAKWVVLCDRCRRRVNHTPEEGEKERVDVAGLLRGRVIQG